MDSDNKKQADGTYAARFRAIITRMDSAYAERNRHPAGSDAYQLANMGVEQVYADLRQLNAEIRGV